MMYIVIFVAVILSGLVVLSPILQPWFFDIKYISIYDGTEDFSHSRSLDMSIDGGAKLMLSIIDPPSQ